MSLKFCLLQPPRFLARPLSDHLQLPLPVPARLWCCPPSKPEMRQTASSAGQAHGSRGSFPESPGTAPPGGLVNMPDWTASRGGAGTAVPAERGRRGQPRLFWQSSFLEQDMWGWAAHLPGVFFYPLSPHGEGACPSTVSLQGTTSSWQSFCYQGYLALGLRDCTCPGSYQHLAPKCCKSSGRWGSPPERHIGTEGMKG